MGIFSRLTDVVNSNIHAMLDKAEDPEKMVRLIIQEMEDTLVEVRSTSVRQLARRKELERSLGQIDTEARDWEAKAELALTKNREDLARGALAARERALLQSEQMRSEFAHVEAEIQRLDEDTAKLRAKLLDARNRQKAIILRSQSVGARLKVKGQIHDQRMADTWSRMAAYEGKIDRMEAELEAYDLGTRDLDSEFATLAQQDKVEDELQRLRQRIAQKAQPDASGGGGH
jgi:phage shock protein A